MRNKKQYSEKEIVKGCIDNDRFFQEMLYRKFFPAMLAMCMRYTKDRDVAMEIINQGFLRVFKKLHTFTFSGSLEGWIRRLVFNSLSDYYKKSSRKIHLLSIEDRDAPIQENALDNLYFEDLLELVNLLPGATQKVFRLYAIEGYTHAEIGELLNISVGTSKWHLSNARKQMKKLIKLKNNTSRYAG